ncbi:hypothetical protein, partial [Acidovorax soli]|uniref:hypothetical protein n=1 Tax=Acidovorax soli TaxID=592050 RepID=UPI0032B2EA16
VSPFSSTAKATSKPAADLPVQNPSMLVTAGGGAGADASSLPPPPQAARSVAAANTEYPASRNFIVIAALFSALRARHYAPHRYAL